MTFTAAGGVERATPHQDQSSTTRPNIRAWLFGPLTISIDGVVADVAASKRVRGLLAYLLAHRRAVPAHELQQRLWPGSSERSARNCLHVAVCHTRAALRAVTDALVVEHHQGSYRMADGMRVDTDIDDFETALALARAVGASSEQTMVLLRRAVDLSGQDFLADDHATPWVAERRLLLRRQAVDARLSLGEVLLARGSTGAAAELGLAVSNADPCDERAHRLAMRAFLAAGERHLARAQLDRCRAALQRSGQGAPDPTTISVLQPSEQLPLFGR